MATAAGVSFLCLYGTPHQESRRVGESKGRHAEPEIPELSDIEFLDEKHDVSSRSSHLRVPAMQLVGIRVCRLFMIVQFNTPQ